MILADTDILSTMAKIARLPLLFTLFQTTSLSLAPGVLGELTHSLALGRQYAKDVFALIADGQIQVLSLTQEETTFRDTLPDSLGAGERESIAIARGRGGIVLSNESRVAYYCRQATIPCLRLPDILRALWVENVLSQQDIHTIIEDLQVKDRMQFKQATLEAIFCD